MFDDFDGSETLCLAFERKTKALIYTEEKRISLNDQDEIVSDFQNEKFNTSATLYREKSGHYKVSFFYHPVLCVF